MNPYLSIPRLYSPIIYYKSDLVGIATIRYLWGCGNARICVSDTFNYTIAQEYKSFIIIQNKFNLVIMNTTISDVSPLTTYRVEGNVLPVVYYRDKPVAAGRNRQE